MENCLKNYLTHIRESVLDSVKEQLSPDLWKGKTILPKVKKQILQIFDDWAKKIDLKVEYTGVKITGSMASYQYNEFSDIDVNVEIDIPEDRRKRIARLLPNGNKLEGTEHPINYYLAIDEESRKAPQFIYDLLGDKWIRDPDKIKIESSDQVRALYKSALDQSLSWMRKISLDVDDMSRTVMELEIHEHFLKEEDYPSDEEEIKQCIIMRENSIKSGYDTLNIDLHMLKQFRKEAYVGNDFPSKTFPEKAAHADYSINNIMYKILEKFGYIDMLYQTMEEYKKHFPKLLVKK
jgi:hypothetical protein